jgi:hypothetical protein
MANRIAVERTLSQAYAAKKGEWRRQSRRATEKNKEGKWCDSGRAKPVA